MLRRRARGVPDHLEAARPRRGERLSRLARRQCRDALGGRDRRTAVGTADDLAGRAQLRRARVPEPTPDGGLQRGRRRTGDGVLDDRPATELACASASSPRWAARQAATTTRTTNNHSPRTPITRKVLMLPHPLSCRLTIPVARANIRRIHRFGPWGQMDDCRATLFPRELLSVQRLAIDWRRHNYMETQDGLRGETEDRLPVEDVPPRRPIVTRPPCGASVVPAGRRGPTSSSYCERSRTWLPAGGCRRPREPATRPCRGVKLLSCRAAAKCCPPGTRLGCIHCPTEHDRDGVVGPPRSATFATDQIDVLSNPNNPVLSAVRKPRAG